MGLPVEIADPTLHRWISMLNYMFQILMFKTVIN